MDAETSTLKLIAFAANAVSRLYGCVLGRLVQIKKKLKEEKAQHSQCTCINMISFEDLCSKLISLFRYGVCKLHYVGHWVQFAMM